MDEFRLDFDRYDKDGDGLLTISEYRQAAHDLDLHFISLDYFDSDSNGEIDFYEFLDMINTNLQISHMKNKFMSMDQDGDGLLTKQELKQGLKQQGFVFNDQELDQIFAEVDVDGNNEIDVQEFLDMISRGLHRQLKRL